MSAMLFSLLLWGLALGPETEAATWVETRPSLWAEAEWPLGPWARGNLTCRAVLSTQDFQLFKDGVVQDSVHLDLPSTEQHFLLGAGTLVPGLYRCRAHMGSRWTELSNLVEVTGTESLPPPSLSAEPVPWVTPGLNTSLLCSAPLRGVTFLLEREGDEDFLEVAEAFQDTRVVFRVHRAGKYSCRYRTHAAGAPSEPSSAVSIHELGAPPAPQLTFHASAEVVLRPGAGVTLDCVAPLSGVEFQLWRDGEELLVPRSSTSPDRVFFALEAPAPGGPYTCRYRLRHPGTAWSADSAPIELLLSDGTLPAPELSAEPADLSPAPGSLVRLRCVAPRAGLRFALVREERSEPRVHGSLRSAEAEALFELPDVSVRDSANYSCVYVDPAPPFAGSAPSAPVHLRVDGPLPRPQLQPLWHGAVTAGRDAVLRCKSRVPDVVYELLREGQVVESQGGWDHGPEADLVLAYVGPQHSGNYSCRYRSWWPVPLESEASDPVELLVAGS
ncbi:alpha-1B-glycoprotein [Dasypus novemcinctus]|uniref:alpha-1B-glycoprotein n=1 Tax=Dasypus novemcinctus TaxID=9361 RepID=UPI00265E7F52|nr:alpha-1B-glycoprotein [Dasypus novemcinctus]